MKNEPNDIVDIFYHNNKTKNTPIQKTKKSSLPKYKIFDEEEFNRGRQVLGDMIVHGMMASGGTDLDWLIEHNGGFIIFEFKSFHNDKINIPKGQMIAYEKLHDKLNKSSKCFLYVVGCDDIDFSNPDSSVWIFEMFQWKNNAIPKMTSDIYTNEEANNKYIVYREYFEEISVTSLRKLVDKHWKEFELICE
ncbi:MAG: hypothetical protein R3327_04515 [Nitrosopumilaceae archaeon]|nr:hypothetical protein [Nitrosopumilaceae archaeon]